MWGLHFLVMRGRIKLLDMGRLGLHMVDPERSDLILTKAIARALLMKGVHQIEVKLVQSRDFANSTIIPAFKQSLRYLALYGIKEGQFQVRAAAMDGMALNALAKNHIQLKPGSPEGETFRRAADQGLGAWVSIQDDPTCPGRAKVFIELK